MDIYDKLITGILVGVPLLVVPTLVTMLVHKWRRRRLTRQQTEEKTKQHMKFMTQLDETRTKRRQHQLNAWHKQHEHKPQVDLAQHDLAGHLNVQPGSMTDQEAEYLNRKRTGQAGQHG